MADDESRETTTKELADLMSKSVAIDEEIFTQLANLLQLFIEQPPPELRETMRGRELELLGARACCLARLRKLSESDSAYRKFLDKSGARSFLTSPIGLIKEVKRLYASCQNNASYSNQTKLIMELCRLAMITLPIVRVTGGDLAVGNWLFLGDVLFPESDVTRGVMFRGNLVEVKLMSQSVLKDPKAGSGQAILGAAAGGYIGAGIGAIAGQMAAPSKTEFAVIGKLADGRRFMATLSEAIYHRLTFMAETNAAPTVEDTKKCPYCAEIIKLEALLCKHCRSELK